MIREVITALLPRKPAPEPQHELVAPPSPSQAGQALSSLTQRSITAREHEQRKAEMTARLRAEIANHHERKTQS